MTADLRTLPVRFSNLKAMARSPRHYAHRALTRFEPTAAMRLGTLVHSAVLGAAHDDEGNPIAFYDGERKGNAWKDFKAANDGAEIFTTAELEKAKPIAAAALSDPLAMQFLAGQREKHIAWEHCGRACSSRLDVLGRHAAGAFVADLKTTSDASVMGFQRQAWKMSYAAQLAFYSDAAAHIGVECVDAYLVAVETSAPYAVTVHRLTKRALDEGRRTYRAWFERLLVCESSRDWPGYALSACEMDVPSWMTDFDDDADDEDEAAE